MAGSSGKGGSRRNQMWVIQGSDARLDAFSKRGKAFVFGPRGVDPLRYRLPNGGKPNFDAVNRADDEEESNLNRLIKEYTDELAKLRAKNARTEQLKQKWMESLRDGKALVDRPFEGLSFEELLILNSGMEEIEKKLRKRMEELSAKPAASTPTSSDGETNAALGGSTENDPSADVHEQ